jgi:hypothetical protein
MVSGLKEVIAQQKHQLQGINEHGAAGSNGSAPAPGLANQVTKAPEPASQAVTGMGASGQQAEVKSTESETAAAAAAAA